MIGRVALLSLEPWDDVWRRNQHFASRLTRTSVIEQLDFVTPPTGGFAARGTRWSPQRGVSVVTPPLVVPRRYGGHRLLGAWLRRTVADCELVWVNDPVAGAAVVATGIPLVYDVTDDWRALAMDGERARVVAAEDVLAARAAATVVCSAELARRWCKRYDLNAHLIGNGADVPAQADRTHAVELAGAGPHVVYVGTVHESRIDLDLVAELGAGPGTLHLVGPCALPDAHQSRLAAAGVRLEGPVPAGAVPSWLAAADVLVCPHLVDDFTRSLDAIKAYEYLATDRPIVATAASGFAGRTDAGLTIAAADVFGAAVRAAVASGPFPRAAPPVWDERAREFGAVLSSVAGVGGGLPGLSDEEQVDGRP